MTIASKLLNKFKDINESVNMPLPGKVFTVDGKSCTVESVTDGMITVRYESGEAQEMTYEDFHKMIGDTSTPADSSNDINESKAINLADWKKAVLSKYPNAKFRDSNEDSDLDGAKGAFSAFDKNVGVVGVFNPEDDFAWANDPEVEYTTK